MATHSSTLAQKIPWMEEPGGLQSMESQKKKKKKAKAEEEMNEDCSGQLNCKLLR